ncbi:MAG: cytochrome P450 [Betaproteobacteria bacterium]|nr:cytochrome P450 [Betaproteobacteria bacterium]
MTQAPVYDPTNDTIRRNPFPLYESLQEHDPIHWSPVIRSWIITRYDDVRQVAMAQTMSSDRLRPFYEALKDERREILSGVMRYLNEWLVFKAAPEHTRLRKMMNAVFSLQMIQGREPQIRSTVEDLFSQAPAGQPFDFMKDVAVLLPAYVILDMMGLPRGDFRMIKEWSDDLRLFIGTSRADEDKYRKARSGADHMSAYFRDVIAQRRATLGDDVITKMLLAQDEKGSLNEDELVAMCMLVLFGGHETTTNLLGSAVVALLEHPQQQKLLRENPQLIDSAVEEFLRYDGPSNSIARVVAVDHELHGKSLKAGERVFAMINAANRDPRRFDRPHDLEIQRSPNRHLTFGQGLHFCLGAPLARLEAKVCINALLGRFASMELGPGDVNWLDALVMRGPSNLPLVLKS